VANPVCGTRLDIPDAFREIPCLCGRRQAFEREVEGHGMSENRGKDLAEKSRAARGMVENLSGAVGVAWGAVGFLGLMGSAVARLSPMAVEAFASEWRLHHWAALAVWVLFMAYSEGYRGFHRAFSPRFGARLRHLYAHPHPMRVVLAPFFAMCLFGATTRRVVAAWGLVFAIVMFVVLARQLAQPWRGIVDAGVVLGLVYGMLSVLYFLYRAFADPDYAVSPEVPEPASPALPAT
jgi:hypothetical protein